jgi:hypothetical protein
MVGAAKHEEKKEADPPTHEVQDNGFIVGAAMHNDEKEADPATQKVQDNDFVVMRRSMKMRRRRVLRRRMRRTSTLSSARNLGTGISKPPQYPKRVENGTGGNLRQKDMSLLKHSRARYYRESGTMNARKKIET